MNGVWDIFDFAWQNPEQNSSDLDDEEDDPSVPIPLALEDGNPNATDEESEVTTTQPEQTAENDDYQNPVENVHLEDSQAEWEPVMETPHLEDVIPASQFQFESDSDKDNDDKDPTHPIEPEGGPEASPPQTEPPSKISDSSSMPPPSSILSHRQQLQARMEEIRPGFGYFFQ